MHETQNGKRLTSRSTVLMPVTYASTVKHLAADITQQHQAVQKNSGDISTFCYCYCFSQSFDMS